MIDRNHSFPDSSSKVDEIYLIALKNKSNITHLNDDNEQLRNELKIIKD